MTLRTTRESCQGPWVFLEVRTFDTIISDPSDTEPPVRPPRGPNRVLLMFSKISSLHPRPLVWTMWTLTNRGFQTIEVTDRTPTCKEVVTDVTVE